MLFGPETKSLQAPTEDAATAVKASAQSEASPFKVRASNTTAPLENWNLTARSKPTPPTVMPFEPKVNA